jgi:hypothetical protein
LSPGAAVAAEAEQSATARTASALIARSIDRVCTDFESLV